MKTYIISLVTAICILSSINLLAQNWCVEYGVWYGNANGYSVDLHWETIWEDALIDSFRVERSPDGNFFNQIGSVVALGTYPSSYDFTDNNVDTLQFETIGYYYRLISYCPTDTTYTNVIIVDYATGINDNKQRGDLSIDVFPNPTTGKFQIQSSNPDNYRDQVERVEVYDLFGRKVLESKEPQIDMSSYPAGLYIWKVGNARGKVVIE